MKQQDKELFDVTPKMHELAKLCVSKSSIPTELYSEYKVNRGLRDQNGNGVITGLTEISEINSFKMINGVKTPIDGELFYRGVNITDLTNGFMNEKRFGFEETAYLLLFGQLPTAMQLSEFTELLAAYRKLPINFVRDVVLKAPNSDMMNSLAKSVLTLYSYDHNANDNDVPNVLRQSLQLIALFPLLSVYAYQAYNHYILNNSLIIHNPDPNLSTAENILYTLRPDSKYTEAEARILDLALVLHAEHGGGNNSTFTTHVVTSSGTDTYSAIAAALSSLKGPRHGGANIKVVQMFNDMKQNLKDWEDEDEIADYLRKLLRKEAFDKAGLIYGMGHAIYTLSDPRANIFKEFVGILSAEKNREKECNLYKAVERIAPKIIGEERKIYKGVSANIDFYSGFVYDMLDLPLELYTPIFAISRIAGWSAHRIEEIINMGKI
ncbi:MAG: citrate/2-methylcitrate synthase, partial [Acutalibacteraceae bacterium]|nr:citrate/2-methylcitrate synthase [Acutalibacteraceae bacterium]